MKQLPLELFKSVAFILGHPVLYIVCEKEGIRLGRNFKAP